MAEKQKRKYAFRKGQIIPRESGSLLHTVTKMERNAWKSVKKKGK